MGRQILKSDQAFALAKMYVLQAAGTLIFVVFVAVETFRAIHGLLR